MTKNTFYVTTPIYYPNDIPHIGHAYTTIAADVLSRWHKLLGKKVFFLTGTDEHGEKIELAAKEKKMTPLEFTNQLEKRFREAWKKLEIEFDDFIRTTDEHHKKYVQELITKVNDKGDIYLGEYEGYYCVPCETYWTELQLIDGNCPECKRVVQLLKEESYFFRLSKYQDKLLDYYKKNPEFISPKSRQSEIINRVKEGLKDLSISRTSFKWGIPFPLDTKHIVYVWFDALTNYISALDKNKNFDEFWPCDVHLVGKDISWFHKVIWPAMLLSAGIELPKMVYSHGWWTVEGEKMSKSKGNFVILDQAIEEYGADALRYFLLRELPFGLDGNFSFKALNDRYNNELGNDLGNLVMRVNALATKYCDGIIPQASANKKLESDALKLQNELNKYYNTLEFNKALDILWGYIRSVNKYINDEKPWELAKNNKTAELATVVNSTAHALAYIAHYIEPFTPLTARKIAEQFSFKLTTFKDLKWGFLENKKVNKATALFARIEAKKQEKIEGIELLNLKVAKVIDVKPHPNAEKLYTAQIDLGTEKRQIVSGLVDYMSADEFKGQNIVVLTNLKPAKLRGVESNGMLLAGETSGKLSLVLAPKSKPGDQVTIEGSNPSTAQIDFKTFQKIKLTVKNNKVYYKDKELKTKTESVQCNMPDNTKIS
ncbi:methionine--tRNA ligase [Candidatus Woesearchaeota archaeon]|nr:methionine--tRNA ligase [Candidatus Woesearchaeota archaeon]